MSSIPAPLLYKIPEAAAQLSMSRAKLYQLINAGRIQTVKEGRSTFITSAALRAYVDRLCAESGQGAA